MLLSSEQLARKIIGLSLRTNELANAMQLSKEHMDKIRCDNQKAIRMEKQMAQARLKEQKNHYETIVTRHQEFIEQVSVLMVHHFVCNMTISLSLEMFNVQIVVTRPC